MRFTVKTSLVATVATALLASAGTASAQPTPMIVGGSNATETYSFMAALSSTDGWGCGASLIRPTWIITAKHCVTLDNGGQSTPAFAQLPDRFAVPGLRRLRRQGQAGHPVRNR